MWRAAQSKSGRPTIFSSGGRVPLGRDPKTPSILNKSIIDSLCLLQRLAHPVSGSFKNGLAASATDAKARVEQRILKE